MRLGSRGDPDIDHAFAGLDHLQRERGKLRCVRGVDHRVPRKVWHLVPLPHPREAQRASELEANLRAAHEMDLGSLGAGELRDEQAHGAVARAPALDRPPQARRCAPHAALCRRARPSRLQCHRRCPAGRAAHAPERSVAPRAHRESLPGCRSRTRSSQTLWRPDRQRGQWPQPIMVSPVTRRPSHEASTPGPIAVTTPLHSWPGRIGYRAWPECRYAISPVQNS